MRTPGSKMSTPSKLDLCIAMTALSNVVAGEASEDSLKQYKDTILWAVYYAEDTYKKPVSTDVSTELSI